MEQRDEIQFDIINQIRCKQKDSSSSASDEEPGLEDSFGTSCSGTSASGTPRSSDSSVITSPRANLLWDHGFDVSKNKEAATNERDGEWRRFSNKTDDDKINADKRMKNQALILNENDQVNDINMTYQGLPDLIPSMSMSSSILSSQETLCELDDLDLPPPLPDSDPPDIDYLDFPPPLPASSPPQLNVYKENESNEDGELINLSECKNETCENTVNDNVDCDSDDTCEICNENDTCELCNENPLEYNTNSEDSSSAAGDLSDQDLDKKETNFDGFYSVKTNTIFKMESDGDNSNIQNDFMEDFEAEFDSLLQSFDAADIDLQETYIERFAGRRDRYGFILSPVIEAPSPTPSNMSGYSGYSGISCSSPDPFSIFRMSPGPNRGSKQDIDLSSLCVKSSDWDLPNEQTVPIYQTVQAKRAIAIPDGYGWESGDDLLSPTGSVEWDCSDNGLSTPPVSTNFINLTQFGTHITGWKQPDVAIYEEPENYESDVTVEDTDTSETNTTLDEASFENAYEDTENIVVKECDSPEKHLFVQEKDSYIGESTDNNPAYENETDELIQTLDDSIQAIELSVLEEEIQKVESELEMFKQQTRISKTLTENKEEKLKEIVSKVLQIPNENVNDESHNTDPLENSLNDSFRGFNAEIADINERKEMCYEVSSRQSELLDRETDIQNSSLVLRCRKPIPVLDTHTHSTTDDDSDSFESNEDAEDEYSGSENVNEDEENKESDSDLFRVKPNKGKAFINDVHLPKTDEVSVSEILTPRSAILKSGGMNPEISDSSSLTSDEDVPDENMSSYGSGIKISQYTSGDSDDNRLTNNKNKTNSNATEKEDRKHNLSQRQESVNYHKENINSIKIESPSVEIINKTDWRKSPKIFGRYYDEMDNELLEEVRSKCDSVDTPRSEPELPDCLFGGTGRASMKQQIFVDVDDDESSFQNVDISDSSIVKSDTSDQHVQHSERIQGERPTEKVHGINEVVQVKQNEVRNVNTNSELNYSPKNEAENTDGHHNFAHNSSENSSPRVNKPETLKIKISHLVRRGSATSKIKHGFVHELSELFDKGCIERENKEVHSKKKYKPKKESKAAERPMTPKIFTPNENVVIFEKDTDSKVDENFNLAEESLGFDVTPLQRVSSFDHIPHTEKEEYVSEEEDSDIENYGYIDDENEFEKSDESSGAELQMYENQLLERENESNYDNQSKGEATLLEDDYIWDKEEAGDTTEFTPKLDTLANINSPVISSPRKDKDVTLIVYNDKGEKLKDDEDEDIEEDIEGDTGSNLSEDEEFHEKYFLPGHSYHINMHQNEISTSQKNDKGITKVTNAYKLNTDFTRPVDQIIIEDAEIQDFENNSDVACEKGISDRYDLKADKERCEGISENANDNRNGNMNVFDECSENIKSEKIKCDGSEKSNIDMSSILWKIPEKSLKINKQGQNAEQTQKNPKKSKHLSGYLQDLLSRINITPRSKSKHNIKSNTRPFVKKEQNWPNNTELKVEIIDKKETVEDRNIKSQSPSQLQPKLTLPVGHYENSEFKVKDNSSTDISANDRDKAIENVARKTRVYGFDEDQRFKIRYPSSLSRPLYQSHCRLQARQANSQREVNPPGLTDGSSYPHTINDSEKNVLLRLSGASILQRRLNHDEHTDCWTKSKNHTADVSAASETNFSHSPTFCDISSDCGADNSSLYIEDQISNPDYFNHTSYTVKTPFSAISQQDRIKFNLKPINDRERNQAQQNIPLSENNFVNVNLQHRGGEARSDKQESNLRATSHYGNRNYDVNFTKLPMHIECKSLNNKCGLEKRDEINRSNLGVDVNSVSMKNDGRNTALGVHIPLEISANETKRENVDMNNDSLSTSHKLDSVETNIPGINNTSPLVTTQNINSYPMSSGDADADDKPVSDEDTDLPEAEEKHISRASVVLRSPGVQHVLEDEKGKLKLWPYSDFDNSDKLPVTLHRVKKRINLPGTKGMSHRSSNMTVIQSAEHSAEMPKDRVVQKYQSSSVLPGDRTADQIMKAHEESVQSVLLQDGNGNKVSEEELAAVLPKIANSISKMESSNAEEILPGITQSITKLKNGGNLVITTMTRKLDEEESSSSGRGSPEPEPDYPVLNVDDLENSKIYLVQDSKGEMFYVEDVTSESQESAYYSSRNTSESVSEPGSSPIFDRISKINSVGESGIKHSTAQEILTAMYGESDVKELNENEEEWSERTYEYDIPRRRDSGTRKEYSKDSFNTSYMVEEPGDTMPKLKSATTKDRYESSYQMSGGSPWVYDGGMSQSYSQMTHGTYPDDSNSVVAVSTQNVDNSGVKTIERYTIEGEAIEYPAPQPMFVPPMVMQTDLPQYSMVKVDVTPKYKEESIQAKIEPPKPEEPIERPIYKTVATITTPEKVPSPKPVEQKKYKIIKSQATKTQEEEQETHMRFDEIDYKFTAENVEYKMRPATTETQYFIKNSSNIQPQSQFRTEKRIELGRNSDQKFKSQIQVQEPKKEVYEQSSYSYDQMKSELEQSESNMRVVRGSYLIKNTLDNAGEEYDDNINMFDGNFNMYKDNPLYKSDEDLYKRLERERLENARRQERLQRDLNQDISFETVDRFSKTKKVQREPEKPRQSIYELLMSRLSTIDKQHIKQTIDVKHDHEDIYGDPRFLQADGEYVQNISGTNDFDTVGEKVDLLLKEGKAYITVKVTAERITPVDLEFNVWRKNQAIVTRTIEVDLLSTEKRRQLYYKVMEEPARGSRAEYRVGPNETILDSKETLELFTKILGAADGEGDTEDIEVKTRSGKTTMPFSTGADLLY